MDSSSAHGDNYWHIPPPLSPLLLICNVAKTRPAKQRTTTHHTGQRPRTPPHAAAKSSPARPMSSLAPSRPRPRRARRAPRANSWEPRLGDRVAPGVPIWHRGAPRPPEQGCCALHRARGGGAHRAGPWAAARAGAGRLQCGAAKRRRARSAICGSRSEPRRRPALQPRAGTYTWHRARQSRWSSARAARRSALRCATPPRPFLPASPYQLHASVGIFIQIVLVDKQ